MPIRFQFNQPKVARVLSRAERNCFLYPFCDYEQDENHFPMHVRYDCDPSHNSCTCNKYYEREIHSIVTKR